MPEADGPTILQRLAAGDPAAPQLCLDAYDGLVWSIARPMLGNGPEAEDAVQDVFIQLWQHAARFDPAKGSEATFVSMLARRRVVDRVRRRQRRPDAEPLQPDLPDAGGQDAAAHAEQADDVQRALAALRSLPPARRQVLGEALLSGRTHAEIAERSGLPLGTVKTHVRRGLQRLRDLLGDDVQR